MKLSLLHLIKWIDDRIVGVSVPDYWSLPSWQYLEGHNLKFDFSYDDLKEQAWQ